MSDSVIPPRLPKKNVRQRDPNKIAKEKFYIPADFCCIVEILQGLFIYLFIYFVFFFFLGIF